MGSTHARNSTRRKRPHSVKSSTKRLPPNERNRAGLYERTLAHIRETLFVTARILKVCAATLKAQAADHDPDVAVILQSGICALLDWQVDEIDRVIGAGELSQGITEERP